MGGEGSEEKGKERKQKGEGKGKEKENKKGQKGGRGEVRREDQKSKRGRRQMAAQRVLQAEAQCLIPSSACSPSSMLQVAPKNFQVWSQKQKTLLTVELGMSLTGQVHTWLV